MIVLVERHGWLLIWYRFTTKLTHFCKYFCIQINRGLLVGIDLSNQNQLLQLKTQYD
jgi:hypothetical protein